MVELLVEPPNSMVIFSIVLVGDVWPRAGERAGSQIQLFHCNSPATLLQPGDLQFRYFLIKPKLVVKPRKTALETGS